MAHPVVAPFDDSFPFLGFWPSGKPISYKGDAHLLTVARPGAGKNRSVILPNLAYYKGSVLVLDPKAENAGATARWREEKLGQKVYVFDPFRVVPNDLLPSNGRASFNPLKLVRDSTTPFSTAFMIAEALIIPNGREPYWDNKAQGWLASLLIYVAFNADIPDDLRTLHTVWRIFADQRISKRFLRDMLETSGMFAPDTAMFISEVAAEMLAVEVAPSPEGGLSVTKMESTKERDLIRSTFRSQLVKTLSEPGIHETLSADGVDFGSFGSVPSSAYICLPGKLASIHSRFMRLLLICAFAQVEDGGLAPVGPGGARAPSTLFIMDEFATLGQFPAITEAMGRMRGYGLKFWTVVQTLSQLKHAYGDGWETIIGNAGITQYFGGTNCLTTADTISKLSNETTQILEGRSGSDGPGSHNGWSQSLYQRPNLYPGEVRSLSDGKQVLIELGEPGPKKDVVLMKKDHSQIPTFRDYKPAPRPLSLPAPPMRLAGPENSAAAAE